MRLARPYVVLAWLFACGASSRGALVGSGAVRGDAELAATALAYLTCHLDLDGPASTSADLDALVATGLVRTVPSQNVRVHDATILGTCAVVVVGPSTIDVYEIAPVRGNSGARMTRCAQCTELLSQRMRARRKCAPLSASSRWT